MKRKYSKFCSAYGAKHVILYRKFCTGRGHSRHLLGLEPSGRLIMAANKPWLVCKKMAPTLVVTLRWQREASRSNYTNAISILDRANAINRWREIYDKMLEAPE